MLGISLVQTYRVQIEEILNKDNGFENLMVKIQEKNN
jgi:ABC-type transporter MlaC component